MSQDFSRNIFFISVSVVTPRVFALWCFYGDELFSLLSSSFSVIQPPLPLPIDKVRTEVCMCVRVFLLVLSCPMSKCLSLTHMQGYTSEKHLRVCVCISNTHKWSLNTQSGLSQLTKECRDPCQLVLQHYRNPSCASRSRISFFCHCTGCGFTYIQMFVHSSLKRNLLCSQSQDVTSLN